VSDDVMAVSYDVTTYYVDVTWRVIAYRPV